MPRTSHCVIWSDGGSAGDVCRLEINHSQVFQTTLNAALTTYVIGKCVWRPTTPITIIRKRLFELCAVNRADCR